MKRSTLCLFILFLGQFLTAQNKQHFGIVAGTDYLMRSHESIDDFYETDPNLHFRLGMNYSRQLSSNWWLGSGLRLTHFRFDTDDFRSSIYQQVISERFGGGGLTGEGEFEGSGINRIQNTDYFAELPLMARYQLQQGRPFYVEAGLGLLFYLSTHTRTDVFDEKKNNWQRHSSDFIDHFMPSLQLSAGWCWSVGEGHGIFLQPSLRYFLPKNSGIRWWSAGLEMGYQW